MPKLNWTVNEDPHAAPATTQAVVFGSRLELRSFRHVPGFLRAALTLRRQLRETPGLFGVSLVAQPTRRTFFTLSAWRDGDALEAFVATPTHQAVMRRYHERMRGSVFTRWSFDAGDLPTPRTDARGLWAEARARLAAADGSPG